MNAPASSRASLITSLLSLLLLLVACVAGLRGVGDVAPQEWWDERGPVVPHDSFPADCSICHEGGDWHTIRDDFEFDHAAETGVELRGAHRSAECLRCHNDRGPVDVFAAKGCAGCHEDVHRRRQGRDCAACHDEESWRPNDIIAQHDRTRFPLVGAHAAVACYRCHEGAEVGVFAPTDTQCEACHREDLARATDPDHVASGFTTACDRCHIATTWSGAGFKHPGFPLTGAHAAADCSDCHTGGVFTGTPSDCYSCHMSEYAATSDPDHTAAGFSTSCELCHNTSTWFGAVFAHTTFPLTGAHVAADCSGCHAGNVFAGTPTDCYSCHMAEYDATANPDHAASGFPTICESCHNTATWFGAVFNHRFPINSGPHSPLDCTDCHTVPNNFVMFSCIDCHDHRQSEMDDRHSDVNGYVWTTSACISCHPTGTE
jgi:hypothetical protein